MWLFICAGMVFVMVVLGGVTRLTHSGLSIVEWGLLSGILPPLSDQDWQELFDRYREFPEYRKVTLGMTLTEFQSIFWLEYIHRLWGRLIGLVFLVPFLYFLWRGAIGRRLGLVLAAVFALGGAQGGLGWLMVASGLVDHPDVSPYRLTAHLALALVIYALLLCIGLRILRGAAVQPATKSVANNNRVVRRLALMIAGVVFLTVLSGGFVAGVDAGFLFNTFPLMEGGWLPPDPFRLDPWIRNFFENHSLVQFDHRLLGMLTLALVVSLWLAIRPGRRFARPRFGRLRLALDFLLLAAALQLGLGIATLLSVVDLALAASHQAGALVLFTLALWTHHEFTATQDHSVPATKR
jgi:cytochrome c oxidase assembly protein subunit 15